MTMYCLCLADLPESDEDLTSKPVPATMDGTSPFLSYSPSGLLSPSPQHLQPPPAHMGSGSTTSAGLLSPAHHTGHTTAGLLSPAHNNAHSTAPPTGGLLSPAHHSTANSGSLGLLSPAYNSSSGHTSIVAPSTGNLYAPPTPAPPMTPMTPLTPEGGSGITPQLQ